MTPNKDLYDKTLDDVFDEEFYKSNFCLYWQTMFAFEKWHSAPSDRRQCLLPISVDSPSARDYNICEHFR